MTAGKNHNQEMIDLHLDRLMKLNVLVLNTHFRCKIQSLLIENVLGSCIIFMVCYGYEKVKCANDNTPGNYLNCLFFMQKLCGGSKQSLQLIDFEVNMHIIYKVITMENPPSPVMK